MPGDVTHHDGFLDTTIPRCFGGFIEWFIRTRESEALILDAEGLVIAADHQRNPIWTNTPPLQFSGALARSAGIQVHVGAHRRPARLDTSRDLVDRTSTWMALS